MSGVKQQTLDDRVVTKPTCQPPGHPEVSCENDVERVIVVYYGGPAMTTIEWKVCDGHVEDVRETGEVREEREYRMYRDGAEEVA